MGLGGGDPGAFGGGWDGCALNWVGSALHESFLERPPCRGCGITSYDLMAAYERICYNRHFVFLYVEQA